MSVDEAMRIAEERYRLLGPVKIEAADGISDVTWEPGVNAGNGWGFVHGGFVATILDETAGSAMHCLFPPGSPGYPTASMQIDYLKGVRPGHRYTGRGRVLRMTRKLAVTEAHIRGDAGLCARATVTFVIDNPPAHLIGFSALD